MIGMRDSRPRRRRTRGAISVAESVGCGSLARREYAWMKRVRLSARFSMISRPPRRSSRRSGAVGVWRTSWPRLPAIDLMGARELLSSWPSTRTRRCQAWSSSLRRAWLRSETTTRVCGSPPSRKVVRRMPQRLEACPGRPVVSRREGSPSSSSPRRRSVAVLPRRRSAGCSSRRCAARLARRSVLLPSKAKMATSISAMTVLRSAVASMALRRCSRRMVPSWLISAWSVSSGSSLSSRAWARIEKSPSRTAERRLVAVCSGRMTRQRTALAKPNQKPKISSERVQRTRSE